MLQQQSAHICKLVGLALVFLTSACGEHPESPPPEPELDARIDLGTGRVSFVSIEEGDPVELVSGPQGGFHLEFTLHLFNVDPENLILDYQVREQSAGKQLSFPARYVIGKGYVLDEGVHFLRVGDRAILDVKEPAQVQGLQVQASCSIERAGIILAQDQKSITIVDQIDELGL